MHNSSGAEETAFCLIAVAEDPTDQSDRSDPTDQPVGDGGDRWWTGEGL